MDCLSYRWTIIFYTTYISVDLAYNKICRAKGGKGGIMMYRGGDQISFKMVHVYDLVRTKAKQR